MNTRNDFLDNAVYDEAGIDGTVDLNTEMCSSMQNDIEEKCSFMSNDKYRAWEHKRKIKGFRNQRVYVVYVEMDKEVIERGGHR